MVLPDQLDRLELLVILEPQVLQDQPVILDLPGRLDTLE